MAAAASRETETKFRVEDRPRLEARLRSLGATDRGTVEESNLLFDDPGGQLRSKGCALRVRWTEEAGLLTFKGKAEVLKGVKSRPEYESAVADPRAVAKVLAALGFSPWFRYEKRRTTWVFTDPDRPVVVIDETPIGLFAEIEGNEDAVRALAAEIEVPESAFIGESYVALYLSARERNPALPKDMIFGTT